MIHKIKNFSGGALRRNSVMLTALFSMSFASFAYANIADTDTTFGTNGEAAGGVVGNDNAQPYSMVVGANDLIYTMEWNGSDMSFTEYIVRRFSKDGMVDVMFGTAGQVNIERSVLPSGQFQQLVIDETNSFIYLAGINCTGVGQCTTAVGRFSFTGMGALDTSFGTQGITMYAAPQGGALVDGGALEADCKLIVSGRDDIAGDALVARLDTHGVLDSSFGKGGLASIDFGSDCDEGDFLGFDSSGNILVAGRTGDSSCGNPGYAIARLNAQGVVDTSFGTSGVTTMPAADTAGPVVVQSSGKLALFFGENSYAPIPSFGVSRLNQNGTLDTSFGSGGSIVETYSAPANFSIGGGEDTQANGEVVLAGPDQNFGNVRQGLSRIMGSVELASIKGSGCSVANAGGTSGGSGGASSSGGGGGSFGFWTFGLAAFLRRRRRKVLH